MNATPDTRCGCTTCPGAGCTCGCRPPAAQTACACGPQCRCGAQCRCGTECRYGAGCARA